jgi:hypothetical protein
MKMDGLYLAVCGTIVNLNHTCFNTVMKKNADGSLTFYIQKDSPGADKEANWLPVPDGPIYLVMRLYWPKGTPP